MGKVFGHMITKISACFCSRFFSNYMSSGNGFHLKYETSLSHSKWSYMVDKCGDGGSLSANGGMITSPSYPGNYPDNADCVYIISQPPDTVILLNFLNMDVENHSTCKYDYLQVRDGSSEGSPLLEKLCGTKTPAPIQSSKNLVWMM